MRLFKINVYPKTKNRQVIRMYLGMLRGLANSIAGFSVLSGLTNEKFYRRKKIQFIFKSESAARKFLRIGRVVLGENLEIRIVVS